MTEPKTAAYFQWQYTASKRNITGKQGYYVYSYSKGLSNNPALLDALEAALGHYCAPDNFPPEPNESQCKAFPRVHSYLRLPNGCSVLCQTVVVGKEYGGTRYLNFFTHAIILDASWFDACNPFGIFQGNPELFEIGLSADDKIAAEKLLPWPTEDEKRYLQQPKIKIEKPFSDFRGEILQKFFAAPNSDHAKHVKRLLNEILATFFDLTNPPNARAVIVTGEDNPLILLQTTLALLPPAVAKRVEFTTYSGEPGQEQRPCTGKCKGWSDSFTKLNNTPQTPADLGVAVIFVWPEVFKREQNAYAVRLATRKEQVDDFQTLRFLDLSASDESTLKYYASDAFLQQDVFKRQALINLRLFNLFLANATREDVARTLDTVARLCSFLENANESALHGIDKDWLNALILALPFKRLSLLFARLLTLRATDKQQDPLGAFLALLDAKKLLQGFLSPTLKKLNASSEPAKSLLPQNYAHNELNFWRLLLWLGDKYKGELIYLLRLGVGKDLYVPDKTIEALWRTFIAGRRDHKSLTQQFLEKLEPKLVYVFLWRFIRLTVPQSGQSTGVTLEPDEKEFLLHTLVKTWHRLAPEVRTGLKAINEETFDSLYDLWKDDLVAMSSERGYFGIFEFWHGYFGEFHEKSGTEDFFASRFYHRLSERTENPVSPSELKGIGLNTYQDHLTGKSLGAALSEVVDKRNNVMEEIRKQAQENNLNFANESAVLGSDKIVELQTDYFSLRELVKFLEKKIASYPAHKRHDSN